MTMMSKEKITKILNSAITELDSVCCSGYLNHVHLTRAIETLAFAVNDIKTENEKSGMLESEDDSEYEVDKTTEA